LSLYSIMSEERIGDKFLRRLYEKTVSNGIESIDRNEIGKEIGIIDVQMDNLVDELTSEGYIKKMGRTKIYLTDDGRGRVEF
jgi:predicted transcriptional regulator